MIRRSSILCLTAPRIRNLLRCAVSYMLSLVGIVRILHRPTFLSVEPANFCSLRCPECPVGRRMYQKDKQLFPLPLFAQILQTNASTLHTVIFYLQGEPLLHPKIAEMIRMAKQAGIYTYLSTNLQALTADLAEAIIAAGVDHIVASIDGLSESSYQAYRQGGSLEKALQGLRYLREAKEAQHASTHIEWQCLRLRSNEAEWKAIQQQYRQLGADSLTFKTAQFYDYAQGNPLMPSKERHSRYVFDRKKHTYHLRASWQRRLNRSCWRLWAGCVVDATGNVLPCCYDKGSQFVFGNLHQQSLNEIWHSEQAQHFRRWLLHTHSAISICQNCPE